jgi:hypothetical protein
MMDDGLGESGKAVRPRFQAGAPEQAVVLGGELPAGRTWLVAGLLGTGKTTRGSQLAFHHTATASLLTGSAAPAQGPSPDAGA